jgi:CheY-like chemotaxis protein/CheY-specific phosphatase CheX
VGLSLGCFGEQLATGLSAAIGSPVNVVRVGDGDLGRSSARLVVMGLAGARPGVLVLEYDAGLTGQIASHVLGREADNCEESELASVLMELSEMLAGEAASRCGNAGEQIALAPAVFCEASAGRLAQGADAHSSFLKFQTDRGALVCGLIQRQSGSADDGHDVVAPSGLRMLVAAGSPLLRRWLTRYATQVGFEVVSVRDGLSALTETERFNPDVVTLDVNLANPDGLACLRRIKETRPETRVLVVSGNGQCDGLQECLALGACGYVLRPFDGRGLEKRLRRIAATRVGRALTPASCT